MEGVDLSCENALALWVLGKLPPERIPDLAARALEHGCEAPSVAALAGMQSPTTRDVEDLLAAVLLETRTARPSRPEALKVVVDECARRIVAGGMAPIAGAREFWQLSRDFNHASGIPEQLRPFVGFASEWEDDAAERQRYEADIVTTAKALLASGGLNSAGIDPEPS